MKTKPTKKLNPNARKWVRALRSGKYKRQSGCLAKTNTEGKTSHCCLGVACELFVKSGGKLKVERPEIGRVLFGNRQDFLPKPVQKWLGLASDNGKLKNDSTLAELNDAGKRFTTIAKIIETKADELFV